MSHRSSGDAYIVVAGGDIGAGRRTTDILDLATMEWREGPSLPHDYCEMDSVQYGNTFALVGGLCNGVVDEVYLYDSIVSHRSSCLSGCGVIPIILLGRGLDTGGRGADFACQIQRQRYLGRSKFVPRMQRLEH